MKDLVKKVNFFHLMHFYINDTGRRYIAKVKGNQEGLLDKVKETIALFDAPTQIYKPKGYTIEGNKMTQRTVELYESSSCD